MNLEAEIFVWVAMVAEASRAVQLASPTSSIDVFCLFASSQNLFDMRPGCSFGLQVSSRVLRSARGASLGLALVPHRLPKDAIVAHVLRDILHDEVLAAGIYHMGNAVRQHSGVSRRAWVVACTSASAAAVRAGRKKLNQLLSWVHAV